MRLSPGTALGAAGGHVLAAVFGTLGAVRRTKPLHPRGSVVAATLARSGSDQSWGVPWLDDPGSEEVVVRLSRAIGLPEGWPDVLGLSIRFGSGEEQHDLLLATTGWSPVTRHLLVPAVDPARARYSTLLPYDTASGKVVLGAAPDPDEDGPAAFGLHVARVGGPWTRFGTLRLHARPADGEDAPLRLDPVRNPLPGLSFPPAVAALREPSYAAARRTPA
jgi:hypothetical protein